MEDELKLVVSMGLIFPDRPLDEEDEVNAAGEEDRAVKPERSSSGEEASRCIEEETSTQHRLTGRSCHPADRSQITSSRSNR